MRRAAITLLVFGLLLGGHSAAAQPAATDDATAPPETLDTTRPGTGGEIALEPAASDRVIVERLTEVYSASGWFEDLEVNCEDGVVTLDGLADHAESRNWAAQVAEATEGVAVVINRLEISVPPAIDSYSVQESLAELWRGFYRLLPLIGVGLLVLILSVVVAGTLSRLLVIPVRKLTDSHLVVSISRKLLVLLVVLVGVIFFLRVSGLTGIAVTIASGTGILGLIIGFAFRDIAENFLASILISVQTPFRLGDVIEVNGYTGVVHKVTARGTVLVDFDGNHIQIANATIYKSTLKNFSANPKRRLEFGVGIGYDASVTTAQDVAMGVLRSHPAVLDDPEPLVLVDQLGPSTINLKVFYWINGLEYSMPKVQSVMMRRVLRAIEQAGISLPDESREIIFPQGVQVSMQPPRPGHWAIPGTGESPGLPQPTPEEQKLRTIDADLADHASLAEGDLSSEVDEIKSQAAESREVERGDDILDERSDAENA